MGGGRRLTGDGRRSAAGGDTRVLCGACGKQVVRQRPARRRGRLGREAAVQRCRAVEEAANRHSTSRRGHEGARRAGRSPPEASGAVGSAAVACGRLANNVIS